MHCSLPFDKVTWAQNASLHRLYAGLRSEPTLLYRTGKEQWSPPKGPEAQRRLKKLCEVFTQWRWFQTFVITWHTIKKVWNHDLAWKVVDVMGAHKVSYYIPLYRGVC